MSEVNTPLLDESLAQVVRDSTLSPSALRLQLTVTPPRFAGDVPRIERSRIELADGTHTGVWSVASIRALFRGDAVAEAFTDQPPAKYAAALRTIEHAIYDASTHASPPRDAELVDVFSAMRRRPDGKSNGLFHSVVWQAAALALGQSPLSQSEYDAIFSLLERSARSQRNGVGSTGFHHRLVHLFDASHVH